MSAPGGLDHPKCFQAGFDNPARFLVPLATHFGTASRPYGYYLQNEGDASLSDPNGE